MSTNFWDWFSNTEWVFKSKKNILSCVLTWKDEEDRKLGCDERESVETAFGKCGSEPYPDSACWKLKQKFYCLKIASKQFFYDNKDLKVIISTWFLSI